MKAARAVLDEHGGDVFALKAAEPLMFNGETARQSGKTGLTNAEAAADEGKQQKHFREVAGLTDE